MHILYSTFGPPMSTQIRYLTPPLLGPANTSKTVTCYRPARSKMPAMNALPLGKQILVNNYGHSGFGWIMAPGATSFVLNQMQSLLPPGKVTSTSVTIVGAGIMGLMAAFYLIQRGFFKITIVAEATSSLTSHNAVGFFSPSIELGKSWMTPDIEDIVRNSYHFYTNIIASQYDAFASTSAQFLPMYIPKQKKSAIVASPHPIADVTLDFGTGVSHQMVEQHGGIIVHVELMMQQLTRFLQNHNVKFIQEKISALSDIASPIVINAAGLGAKELVADDGLVPVQGHLIHLTNQPTTALNYLLMMDCEKAFTGTGFQVKRSLYWAPRRYPATDTSSHGILGATSIKGSDHQTPHTNEFNLILERSNSFFYGM